MPIDKTSEFIFGEPDLRSVRDSVAMLVKTIPVDTTLSTSGTAENLISLESNSPPAYNLITNPSFETGAPPTSWVAVGSTLASVQTGTVVPRTGVDSLQITTDNAAANEGGYYEETALVPGWYALSCYVQRGGGGTAQIRSSSDGGSTFITGNTVTMNGTWQRLTVTHEIRHTATTLRLYVDTPTQQNIVYWVEDAQMEPAWKIIMGEANARTGEAPQVEPTAFIDVSGDRFSRWLGTANASKSIREPTLNEIMEVHLEAVNADVYIDFDRTAQNSGGGLGVLLRAGDTMNGRKVIKSNISIINSVAGQLPRVRGWVLGR